MRAAHWSNRPRYVLARWGRWLRIWGLELADVLGLLITFLLVILAAYLYCSLLLVQLIGERLFKPSTKEVRT